MKALTSWVIRNKVIAVVSLFLLFVGILYLLFAHQLIEASYEGKTIPFLSKLISASGRERYPLGFYIDKADKTFLELSVLVLFIAQGSSVTSKLLQRRKRFTCLIGREIRSLRATLSKNKKVIFLQISLLFLFYCLYLFLGTLVIRQIDYLSFFGADPSDSVNGWTSFDNNKWHKGVHPLILFFTNPAGTLIHHFIASKELSVVILNSFFGALGVFLSSIFFWKLTRRYAETTILTIVFALSMSQIVFSTVPETYALAGCSVITTYILFLACLKSCKLQFGYWIIAGIFSFGITITNFSQTLICFAIVVLTLKKRRRTIIILDYISIVVLFAFVLSFLQRAIFAGSKFFFLPLAVEHEYKSVNVARIFSQPFLVIQELVKNFFLVNFVSSSPFTRTIDPEIPSHLLLGFFERPLNYSLIGLIGAILWVCLFVIGFFKNIFSTKNTFILATSISILGNMALYSFFGTYEMFLYTCNFTFPVLLLAVNSLIMKKTYFKVGLVLLIVLMGINNLLVMKQIIYA